MSAKGEDPTSESDHCCVSRFVAAHAHTRPIMVGGGVSAKGAEKGMGASTHVLFAAAKPFCRG